MNPDYDNIHEKSANNAELGVFRKPLTSSFMSKELHDETIDMYLKAARQNHISISYYSKCKTLYNLNFRKPSIILKIQQ